MRLEHQRHPSGRPNLPGARRSHAPRRAPSSRTVLALHWCKPTDRVQQTNHRSDEKYAAWAEGW
eukprot:5989896-Amphidinium_carterae.1